MPAAITHSPQRKRPYDRMPAAGTINSAPSPMTTNPTTMDFWWPSRVTTSVEGIDTTK